MSVKIHHCFIFATSFCIHGNLRSSTILAGWSGKGYRTKSVKPVEDVLQC